MVSQMDTDSHGGLTSSPTAGEMHITFAIDSYLGFVHLEVCTICRFGGSSFRD